jgi:hypothetical protein
MDSEHNHHRVNASRPPWTGAEIAMLRRMHRLGARYRQMAVSIGRSKSAISGQCRRLGLRRRVGPVINWSVNSQQC